MTHPAAPLPRPHPGVGLHEVPAMKPGFTRVEVWVSWLDEPVSVFETLTALLCEESCAWTHQWAIDQDAAGPPERRPHLQLVG